jgi:hypothetical protein
MRRLSSRSMCRWIALAGLLVSCSSEGADFSSAQKAAAGTSAAEVDRATLRARIQAMVGERAQETPELVSWYPNHPHTHFGRPTTSPRSSETSSR